MMTLKKFKRMKTIKVVVNRADEMSMTELHVDCPVPIKFLEPLYKDGGYYIEATNTTDFWLWYAGIEVTDDWNTIYKHVKLVSIIT